MASAVSSWSSTIYAPSGFFGSNAGFSQRSRLTDRQFGSTRAEVTSPLSTATSPKKGKAISKKPKVMLRFVWMDKNIGIGLDQVVPGHGTVPLSSYYFWPRKDAWEEIKTKLEGKKWISRKQTILLLNQATDVINLWQQNATV